MHSSSVCPHCGRPLPAERLCQKCAAGLMRVVTSRRVGSSQKQYLRCTNPGCAHRDVKIIPRENVSPRHRSSKLDQLKSQITGNLAMIQSERSS